MLRCGVGVCQGEASFTCTNFNPKNFIKKVKFVYRCVVHRCEKCKLIVK